MAGSLQFSLLAAWKLNPCAGWPSKFEPPTLPGRSNGYFIQISMRVYASAWSMDLNGASTLMLFWGDKHTSLRLSQWSEYPNALLGSWLLSPLRQLKAGIARLMWHVEWHLPHILHACWSLASREGNLQIRCDRHNRAFCLEGQLDLEIACQATATSA